MLSTVHRLSQEPVVPSFVERIPAGQSGLAPPPPPLGPEDRAELLEVARCALRFVTGDAPADVLHDALDLAARRPVAHVRAAAFVTLLADGELRGCMGVLDDTRPVAETVADAAVRAASSDPRFWPVRSAELAGMHLGISVLGAFARLADPRDLVAGLEGVLIESAGRAGLLLPEVAVDHGWDGPQLLEAVCEKASLPADAWQDPRARLSVFRSVRFGGPALA
jgi:AmmeMemoRadiSam system protein A